MEDPAPDPTPDPRSSLRAERERTAARLARLRGDVEEVMAASLDTNADDEHDPEGATIAFERSQLSTLLRQAEQRLVDLDAALARAATGEYGRCEVCGEPIDAERLAVRPQARTCVPCAARG